MKHVMREQKGVQKNARGYFIKTIDFLKRKKVRPSLPFGTKQTLSICEELGGVGGHKVA